MMMAVGSSPSCPGVSSGLATLYLGSNDARDGWGFQCHLAFLWHSGSHVISSGSKMACSSTLLLYISGCA